MNSPFRNTVAIYESSPLAQFAPIVSAHEKWHQVYGTGKELDFWILVHGAIQSTGANELPFEQDALRNLFNKSTTAALKNKLRSTFASLPNVNSVYRLVLEDIRESVCCGVNEEVKGIGEDERFVFEGILHRSLDALDAALHLHEKRLMDYFIALAVSFESIVLLRYLHKHRSMIAAYRRNSAIQNYETSREYFDLYHDGEIIDEEERERRLGPLRETLTDLGVTINEDGAIQERGPRFNWERMAREALVRDEVFRESPHLRFLELMEWRNNAAHTRWNVLGAYITEESGRLSNAWRNDESHSMHPYTFLVLHEYFVGLRLLRPSVSEDLPGLCLYWWQMYDRRRAGRDCLE